MTMIFKAVLIILVCTHSFVMANECCCNPLSKQPKSPTVIYCDNRAPTQEMLISGNSREIAPENIRVIHESRATTANSQSSIYQQTCDSSTKISSSNFTVSTSLDQFSSTLEAPLCSILESLNGFSECKETLDDDCRNSLALAVEAIDIIQNLIMNRFAFSKLETDSFELTYSSFTIHDLIQQTIKIMSHKSRDRKLTLTYSVDSAVPVSLIGDEGRLRQILLNLVGNAIKFTENGGVKIGIKALPTNDDSTTLRFEIEDSGKGMTTEEMGKLFMPYVQANSSIVAQHGGTGLDYGFPSAYANS